jgi:hypothetical protein
MRNLHRVISLALFLSAGDLAYSQAREADPDTKKAKVSSSELSAEVRAGLEYDSNVSVEEVDQSSGQSDYAAVFDGQLKYKSPLTQESKVSLGYDFSQSLYDEFSVVDRQTHMLSAGFSSDLEKVDLGANYRYIYSRLDGDKFLTMHQVSPYLSAFLTREWFWRGAYRFSDKKIDQNPGRDATYHSGELDVYYFVNGLRSYFNLGYRYKDEEAETSQFDYTGHRLKLRYVQRFDFFTRQAKATLALRYEDRDYSSLTPGIGEKREDERYRADAELEIPLGKQAAISIYYRYNDNQSNLPSVDYDQYVAGSQFLYRW